MGDVAYGSYLAHTWFNCGSVVVQVAVAWVCVCGSCMVHMWFSCGAAISGLSFYGSALGSGDGAVVCGLLSGGSAVVQLVLA